MKRHFPAPFSALLAAISLTLASGAFAEDVDTSNHPDTIRVNISPYTIGLGAGAIAALNPELQDESDAFLKLSLVQSIAFGEHMAMGLDIDWFAPGGNWGGDLTVSYLMGNAGFQPFIGGGAGFHYFDKAGTDFGQGLGPSVVAHAGVMIDVLDELQMRIRVPFYFVANEAQDRGVGVDVAFLLGSPLRTKKVKKLIY